MSSTIDFATVVSSIAGLTISGITVQSKPTDAVGVLSNHILSPHPNGFISDVSVAPAELSKQNLDVRYTLHYDYFECPAGAGLNGLYTGYSGLISSVALILAAFAKHETLGGAIDNGEATVDMIGLMQDNAGNAFFGAEISIHILQFLEV